MKSRASESKQQKELVVSDDDKPPTRSALTQSLKISVRNITARPAPYIHRDIDPRFDRTKIRSRPAARKPSRPRVSPRALSDGDRRGVERLALAVAQPHQQPRAARDDLIDLSERRAPRADRGRLDAAARHHAVLHEPARSDRTRTNALRRTVVPVTGEFLRGPQAKPTTRSAKTATARCRVSCIAIPTACCFWRSTSARRIAATARARASSATANSRRPTRAWTRCSTTSAQHRRSATC